MSPSGAGLPLPTDLLAHRDPFLFVTRLLELEPGQRVVAEWDINEGAPFFAGHFPGRPTLPGVLQLEALAQAAACAVLADERHVGRLPLFGGVDRARFRRQVVPGTTMRLDVQLDFIGSRGGRGTGRATVDGQLTCEAAMLFVFAPVVGPTANG